MITILLFSLCLFKYTSHAYIVVPLAGKSQNGFRRCDVSMGFAQWMPSIKGIFPNKKSSSFKNPKLDGAALFRQLGVSEDASYEEIQEATLKLRTKYQGDKKQQIRIDKLKDDIMELRLRQRMSSMAGQSRDLSMAAQAELNISRKNVGPKMPKWLRGIIHIPNREWAISAIYPFSMMGAFGALFPSSSNMLILISAMYAVSRMSSRSAPPIPKDELGQMGPMPMPSKETVIMTLFIALSAWFVGVRLGRVLATYMGQAILLEESWKVIGIEIMFSFCSLFFDTYRK
mmetsp:Transcript_10901/g.15483  ORF Transcript_10901/g.15483 Transcript_10901/m.15483 type:complete len:287 (+) Transcript_10901:39-899(+)